MRLIHRADLYQNFKTANFICCFKDIYEKYKALNLMLFLVLEKPSCYKNRRNNTD